MTRGLRSAPRLTKDTWTEIIRRYIDGEIGTNLAKVSMMVEVSLQVAGTEELMLQFKSFIDGIVPNHQNKVRPHKSIFVFSLSGGRAEAVIAALYVGASTVLDRKAPRY